MDLLSIAADPVLLSGGVWWDFQTRLPCAPKTAPHAEHFCVLVVPFGVAYDREVHELSLPHADEIRRNKGRMPDEIDSQVRAIALGRHVLKGWSNAELGGKALAFSPDTAAKMLADPKWYFLRGFIESAARSEQALLLEEERQAAGN